MRKIYNTDKCFILIGCIDPDLWLMIIKANLFQDMKCIESMDAI